MIDIHCHLLPQVDDGPDAIADAIEMARMAAAHGITHAVLTPHLHPGRYENTASTLVPAFAMLRRALKVKKIPLELGLACEMRISPEILPLIERNELPFLGEIDGQRVMLLEFPHGHIPLGADKLVERLLARGVRPLIAHPERNKDVMRDRDKLRAFEEMGCLFQLTAGSLAGRFGEQAERCALELLESPSTFVIASDAHNLKARPPELLHGHAVAVQELGQEAADRLVKDNPWQLVRAHFEATTPITSAPEPATASEAPGTRARWERAMPATPPREQATEPPAPTTLSLAPRPAATAQASAPAGVERALQALQRELRAAAGRRVDERLAIELSMRMRRVLEAELTPPAPDDTAVVLAFRDLLNRLHARAEGGEPDPAEALIAALRQGAPGRGPH